MPELLLSIERYHSRESYVACAKVYTATPPQNTTRLLCPTLAYIACDALPPQASAVPNLLLKNPHRRVPLTLLDTYIRSAIKHQDRAGAEDTHTAHTYISSGQDGVQPNHAVGCTAFTLIMQHALFHKVKIYKYTCWP